MPLISRGENERRRPSWTTWLALLPLLLLAAQILRVHDQLLEGGHVHPIRVPDTDSYVNHSQLDTVNGKLMHYRSLGYPELVRIFGWRELAGPELWMYFAGVVVFFWGVFAYTGSSWVALAAASPLLYGHTFELLGRIQPDFVSCAFVLAAVGALLLIATWQRNPLYWLLLAIAVFASYQLRPATLFLILWLPAVAWVLVSLKRGSIARPALGWAALVAVVTVGPFLAFAGWRYSRVGEFGLVSFGGYNMAGLAASLVDEEMLDELEGESRRMARQMYKMRERRGWEPYRPGEGSEEWFEQYSENIFRIGVQTAKQQIMLDEGSLHPQVEPYRSLHVRVNDRLRQVSRQIIRRRLASYLCWMKDANLYGWRQLGDSPWVVWPAALLGLSLLVDRAGRSGALGRRERWRGLPATSVGLLVAGVGLFAAYVFLISLLSFPFSRYYYGAVLLLPSGLCGALAALWLRDAGLEASVPSS